MSFVMDLEDYEAGDKRYAVLGLMEELELEIIRYSVMISAINDKDDRNEMLKEIEKCKMRLQMVKETFPEYII